MKPLAIDADAAFSANTASGVRDFEHIRALAGRCGLALIEENAMPANNRLLVFESEN